MKKRFLFLLSLLLISILAVGCGGASTDIGSGIVTEESFDLSYDAEFGTSGTTNNLKDGITPEYEYTDNTSQEKSEVKSTKKLIKTVNMDVETKAFDELLDSIQKEVSSVNGYIEDSSVSGNSYKNVDGTRWANFTIRIPENKLGEFVLKIGNNCNVLSKKEAVKDVTLQYTDVESHKKVLLLEQERLMDLLEKANNMNDIIIIEQRLSEVRYEIESYESQLRVLDNKINYSTVHLSIDEVEKLTPIEDKSFFSEIGERFSNNFNNSINFVKNTIIWFVSSIPYFVLIAIVPGSVYLFVKKVEKNKMKKKKDNNET